MMRRILQLSVVAFALTVLCQQEASSQDRMPAVPSSQAPAASVSFEGTAPAHPLTVALVARTSQESETAVSASENPLSELAWMVGDWVDQDEEATSESSVSWSKNKVFLIRSFRLSLGGDDPLTGMQVIAWDPAEKHIRSWTYDSRGGFGEESWTRAGDRWSMRTRFTLPDGGRASAVHVMTRESDDLFRWKSVGRVIDGSLQPDIDEVTFIRKTTEVPASAPEATKLDSSSQPQGETKP